ncbi:MAG: Rieske (2Fe-2S) protein [Acidimicrobiia bacterium]|nr:Rieske (2Fe-2S) protein [Acidimicrobiia bacterium]
MSELRTRPGSERFAERTSALAFVLSAMAFIGLAAVYWRGGQPQAEGALLAVGFAGLAYGLVTWGNHLLPQGPFEEARHRFGDAGEETLFGEDLSRGQELTRRKLLVRTLVLAVGGLGVAAVFPIRSLGPKPGRALLQTPWRAGMRAVTEDGRPVLAAEVPVGGLVTVFPEGHAGSANGQAVLIRVEPGLIVPLAGRETWAPDGYVIYSKICTHAGCPVGLYQRETQALLCPCHQSEFDVLHHAQPIFGPAAAPLPQLPIVVGDDGFIRATGDFSEPVGPTFWRRT